MHRSLWFRACLLASLLVPAAAVMSLGLAEAQGVRFETVWKCGKCRGYLGEGDVAPTYCPHCKSKLSGIRSSWMSDAPAAKTAKPKSGTSEESTAAEKIAVVVVVGLAVVGPAVFVMKSWT